MHLCSKNSCPNRIAFGKESDTDREVIVCLKCSNTIYHSRSKNDKFIFYFKRLIILIPLFVLAYLYFKNIETIKSWLPKTNVTQAFDPRGQAKNSNDSTSTDEESEVSGSPEEPFVSKVSDSVGGVGSEIIDKPNPVVKSTNDKPVIEPPTPSLSFDLNIPKTGIEVGTPFYPRNTSENIGSNFTIDFGPDKFSGRFPTSYTYHRQGTYDIHLRTNDGIKYTESVTVLEVDKTLYYRDIDGDRLGDPNDSSEFQKAKKPVGKWVNNRDDKCPARDGNGSADGCPTSIDIKDFTVNINESKAIPSFTFDQLQDDQISWAGSSGLRISAHTTVSPIVEGLTLGKQTLQVNIKGVQDRLNLSKEIDVCVKLTDKYFKELLDPLVKHGQFNEGTAVPSTIKIATTNNLSTLRNCIDQNTTISNKGVVYGNNVESYFVSKIVTQESFVREIKINRMKYNQSTCVLENLDVSLIK